MKDKIINIITDYYDDGDSERHEMVANDLLNLFPVIKCDNIKKGETLILDNSLEVEVITPESMALVKDSRDETLTWVDKKRLKRK